MTRTITCSELEAWLDQGMPEAGAKAGAAHASICSRCADLLAVARALESLLEAPPAPAPPALVSRAMAVVEQPVVAPAPAPSVWAGSGVALGLVAAAFAARDPSLRAVARSLGPAFAGLDDPTVLAALALGLAPALALAALPLFHWAERLAERGEGP